MFDAKWEEIHKAKDWGRYPNEEMVRWVSINYGGCAHSYRHKFKFLDLGCGQGATTWYLSREGYKVVSIDGSKSAISKLTDRMTKEMFSLETAVCDIGKVPYEDKHFNAVIDVVS